LQSGSSCVGAGGEEALQVSRNGLLLLLLPPPPMMMPPRTWEAAAA